MDDPVYHVVLEGRQIGPYDRRTIVGMRIKKTLTSEHELIARDGSRLSVADLLKTRPRDNSFQPNRSGTYSLVQASYSASLVGVQGPGMHVPTFKGEIEARVQSGVLRMAGRFRARLGWREDRVKLPLKDIVHARVRNSLVDLWLRNEGQSKLQRVTLELFTHVAAGELVEWLPSATPWPNRDSEPAGGRGQPQGHRGLWIAGAACTAAALVVVLVVLLSRRMY